MALEAALGVPRGPAVAPQDDVPALAARAPARVTRRGAGPQRRQTYARPGRWHRLRQRDHGAVPPEPLEGVVDALLDVLDVDDDVDVVEQDPATLALALAAGRAYVELDAQALLDGVDDRADLPVVGRRAEEEGVGDDQLLGHVEGDDVLGELVGCRFGGGHHQGDGLGCCGHEERAFTGSRDGRTP